jgi:hypothetical protein
MHACRTQTRRQVSSHGPEGPIEGNAVRLNDNSTHLLNKVHGFSPGASSSRMRLAVTQLMATQASSATKHDRRMLKEFNLTIYANCVACCYRVCALYPTR